MTACASIGILSTAPPKLMNSIFSTYSTGENRVTASLLAVLSSLSLSRIQRLLGALLEQSDFELIRFENQPSKGAAGVPDAVIQASIRLLVETKVRRNAILKPQLERHLERLSSASETTRLLLVLTPDDVRPPVLDAMKDDRIVWTSFAALDQAIDEVLEDKYEVVSDRETFLLRELQNMLNAESLLASENDVVVVAARNAWPEYNQIHAYVCQPNRPFQRVQRLAFFSKGQIHELVPRILQSFEDVITEPGRHDGALGDLVKRLVKEQRRELGAHHKVLLLSDPDSAETVRLPQPILNDLKSRAGKPTAFTMGQRYVVLERLLRAKTTSDLSPTNVTH